VSNELSFWVTDKSKVLFLNQKLVGHHSKKTEIWINKLV